MFQFLKALFSSPEPMYSDQYEASQLPPTERQVAYCKRLGIIVMPNMSKLDVSRAIDAHLARHPELRPGAQAKKLSAAEIAQKEQARRAKRIKKYGEDLVKQEEHWTALGDRDQSMVAVVKRGSKLLVQIVRIENAWIDDKTKKPRLCITGEKAILSKDLGYEMVDFDGDFDVPMDRIVWHQIIGELVDDNIAEFHRAIEMGKQAARNL